MSPYRSHTFLSALCNHNYCAMGNVCMYMQENSYYCCSQWRGEVEAGLPGIIIYTHLPHTLQPLATFASIHMHACTNVYAYMIVYEQNYTLYHGSKFIKKNRQVFISATYSFVLYSSHTHSSLASITFVAV